MKILHKMSCRFSKYSGVCICAQAELEDIMELMPLTKKTAPVPCTKTEVPPFYDNHR